MVFGLVLGTLPLSALPFALLLIGRSLTPKTKRKTRSPSKKKKKQVSDEGGGIARSGLPKIWTYLYSTAKNPVDMASAADGDGPAVLAGYGYG